MYSSPQGISLESNLWSRSSAASLVMCISSVLGGHRMGTGRGKRAPRQRAFHLPRRLSTDSPWSGETAYRWLSPTGGQSVAAGRSSREPARCRRAAPRSGVGVGARHRLRPPRPASFTNGVGLSTSAPGFPRPPAARTDRGSVAPVDGVAAVAEAPGELALHRDGLLARGHWVEVAIQAWAQMLPMLSHMPGGPVALFVLAKAFRRRDRTLSDVDGGMLRVATVAHRVVQFDDVDVVAAWRCSRSSV